jgi:hypothetical protein
MRRIVAILAVTASGLILSSSPASAYYSWCSEDPLLSLTAPSGSTERVYVTDYASPEYEAQLAQVQVSYTISKRQSTYDGTVLVYVPRPEHQAFVVRTVVSTGPDGTGSVLGAGWGRAGKPYRVAFQTAWRLA